MLISHRNSAYMDMDEEERAAGIIEQHLNSGTLEDHIEEFNGASLILRLLLMYDFKTAEDLILVFQKSLNSKEFQL